MGDIFLIKHEISEVMSNDDKHERTLFINT